MKPWQVRRSRVVLERPWITVREEHVVLPTGAEIAEYHVIESRDWAAVLALTDANEVLLVEQHRHGIGAISRELPAGVIDDGETPLEAARRELAEETGYQAPDWQPLERVAVEPTRHTYYAHFFVARGAVRARAPRLDPGESIDVVLMAPAELLRWIDEGRIQHGVHVGAILLAARRGLLG